MWSLSAAVGLFTAGAVMSVQHGISGLIEPEPGSDFGVANIGLAVAAVLEGISCTQSIVQARKQAAKFGRFTVDFALNSFNPALRAVLAEDAAAIAGLAIAFAGILLHQVTGNAVWDAVGSLLIGLLLGAVAIILINRNRRFLVGQTPGADVRRAAGRALTEHPEINRMTDLHLEFGGPSKLFVVAAVDLAGDRREEEAARQLRALERSMEQNDFIRKAVLTLSVSDESTIGFA